MGIYKRTELAVAVAYELGTHIDDLSDGEDGVNELHSEDGERLGVLVDTVITGQANSFVVVMEDDRKVRVTCEEML